jgi:hypothetical protein
MMISQGQPPTIASSHDVKVTDCLSQTGAASFFAPQRATPAAIAMAMPPALHWRSTRHDTCTRPAVVIQCTCPVSFAQHKVSCTWTRCSTVQRSAVQRSTAQYTAVGTLRDSSALCTAPALQSALGRSRSQPWRSSHSAISLTAHTSQLIGADSSRAGLPFQLVICPCRVCHDNNSWADAGVIDINCLRPAQPLLWLLSAFPVG